MQEAILLATSYYRNRGVVVWHNYAGVDLASFQDSLTMGRGKTEPGTLSVHVLY